MRSLVIAGLVVGAVSSVAPWAAAQSHPALKGHWVLKVEPGGDSITDALADSAADSDSAAPAPPAPDLRPHARRGKPEDQQQLAQLVGMAQPVAGFVITQTDSSITFTNDDGFSYTVRPGRRDSLVLDDGRTVEMRARWRGKALEVQTRPEGGGQITETYYLADSRQYLRLEIAVEHDLLVRRLWRARMYRRDDGA